MWQMSVPWWEFVARGIVVYLFLLVFMRLTGKRQTGQYEPFDLILLLILSNAVQNSMNAGDNSLVGGLISASTLMLCHAALARLAFHFPRVGYWVDGKAQVLIDQGKIDQNLMRQELLTREDVEAALRAGGRFRSHNCHTPQGIRRNRPGLPGPAPEESF